MAVTVCTVILLCVALLTISSLAEARFMVQKQPSEPAQTASQKKTVKRFEKRVKEYVRLRERLEGKLPGLSNQAKPERIEAHKKAFEDIVRKARANAKPGDILSSDIASYIRNTIKTEFKGTDRKQLRETILEADTKGVPLRVNYPYPETKELTQIPPTLLLKLPQLPKQVKYRFVGRHLLLVDRENGLIVDYMMNALLK
ncbi:MAG: hypothetical protein AABO57_08550 [Acidobacteriota bacterium]